jgi:4-hydroxy-tetrahydrodipicolinate reductase
VDKDDQMTKICLAGATGWTGSAVARAILDADDLTLHAAVARSVAGQDLGAALGEARPWGVTVQASVPDAVAGADVLIDYTGPAAVKANVLTAIEHGAAVVVGSSGLTAEEYAEIDARARERGVGVVAAGNFSLTAAIAQAAALLAARYLPQWEIIDYASSTKPDVPSGTARELADRLGAVRRPELGHPIEETFGPIEARGADVAGSRVHSLRLPGYVLATEVLFGLPDERLTIRHDAGTSAAPYVAGTLLAARAVVSRVGLTRGLDTLLFDR